MNLNIGIDIGEANARMTIKGRGPVLDQPSACAFKNGSAISLGDEAYSLWGREFGSDRVSFPMWAGVISDEIALEAWLKYMIGQASAMGLARVCRVLISKPVMMGLSQAQRYAALAMRAGAAYCALISSDILAAIGSGVDIKKPRGSFVMDIGASHMSATAIVRSKIVSRGHLNYGMDSCNDIITRMIRDKYSLAIGPATAEAVKKNLADASPKGEAVEVVTGFDLAKGFPGSVKVTTADIRNCIEPLTEKARQLAMSVMGELPPLVQADILEDGAHLTGGGAYMYGLAEILQSATGTRFTVGENPRLAVACGLLKVLESPDDYESCMEAQQSLFDKRTPGR